MLVAIGVAFSLSALGGGMAIEPSSDARGARECSSSNWRSAPKKLHTRPRRNPMKIRQIIAAATLVGAVGVLAPASAAMAGHPQPTT